MILVNFEIVDRSVGKISGRALVLCMYFLGLSLLVTVVSG